MFWVYILQNGAGRFYVGQTDNLSIRLANHNRTDTVAGKKFSLSFSTNCR
jgi:predicted GIY-YIG superfamily endonuclease